MTLRTPLKFSVLFTLLVCAGLTKSNAQDTKNQIEGYPTVKATLNKKVWTLSKSYYLITRSTDSTVHLFWGNDAMRRMFKGELELWAAERLFRKWSNKDYLILEYWTGSGVWLDLILPMNKKEKIQEFGNALCFDNVYNLLAVEQFRDTILSVENLKTKKRQYIIDKKHTCDGALNSSCIDTIAIKNKVLYIKWVVPNNYTEKKKTYEKKVKLQL